MKTDQEKFWSSDFGNKYTERTHLERKYFTTRVKMWSDILMHSNDIKSVFEIGSNTGINMEVIQFLLNKKTAHQRRAFQRLRSTCRDNVAPRV